MISLKAKKIKSTWKYKTASATITENYLHPQTKLHWLFPVAMNLFKQKELFCKWLYDTYIYS